MEPLFIIIRTDAEVAFYTGQDGHVYQAEKTYVDGQYQWDWVGSELADESVQHSLKKIFAQIENTI